MCPTVWIGRFSSVVVAPVACKARLHMSHRLDLFLLNLLVKAFTGKLLVMICEEISGFCGVPVVFFWSYKIQNAFVFVVCVIRGL
jgi:hypothetical protein